MYKKIIAVGLTFLLCAGLTACSPNNDTQESITSTPIQSEEIDTDNELNDETESALYENFNLGFSMQIPFSWEGKYTIEELEQTYGDEGIIKSISFSHNATMDEMGSDVGWLFSFGKVTGEHFTEDEPPIMSGQTIILAQTGGYTYYVHFPSGVEYNDDPESESAVEYKEMVSQVDFLINTFKLITSEISLSVDYATDELLAEFDSYIDKYVEYEYAEKVIFKTNTKITNFRFIEVRYKEEGEGIKFYENAVLYSIGEFMPEQPLVVAIDFPGVLPTKGISFIDENNITRHLYVAMSGENGSLSLVEFWDSVWQSITVTSESQIEVNRTFDNNVSSEGHFYRGEKLITENPDDITFLSFYQVDFSSFDALQELSNLTRIEFFSCNFADGITFPEMESVEQIIISDCNLKSLDILVLCTNIKHLQVAYSDIDDLGSLSHFQSLETLSLIGNRITKPLNLEPLSALTNLETLDLVDGNKTIESLKPLYALDKLTFIQVCKSALDSLSKEETEYFKDILAWD